MMMNCCITRPQLHVLTLRHRGTQPRTRSGAQTHTHVLGHAPPTRSGTQVRVRAGAPRCLTVGGQQGVGSVLLGEPFDLVDFLLYLQALEIVELGLVALEGAVDIILALVVRSILALQGEPDGA